MSSAAVLLERVSVAPPGPIGSNPLIVGPTPSSVKCSPEIDTHWVTGKSGFGKSYGKLLALEMGALRVHTVLPSSARASSL